MPYVKDLDTSLLKLSPQDTFTLRDACAGVHIFGGIGSGKTSGSGRMLAGAYLRAGMGGLVTAVKPEEVETWRRYAAEHGRSKSLLLFDENEGFNFISYELARHGLDGISTVTDCLMHILEAAKSASGTASQRGGDPFWEDAARQVLRYSIPPIYAAQGSVSVADIIRFVSTAPTNPKERFSHDWQQSSFMYQAMQAAVARPRVSISSAAMSDNADFWAEQFAAIPEKTRGNIVATVTTVLDRFKHGRLQRAFCEATTVVPELSLNGMIIVLAMPTLTWNEDGIIAQQLFKYMWQRAVLNRNSLAPEYRERPVFLWSDEAQETVNSYDAEYQSICRGSKACTVYLTQSLPTYYAKMRGDNSQHATHALVGKFMSQIFHSNSCPDTNEYASRVIGKVVKKRSNYSSGRGESFNYGMSMGDSENTSSSSNRGASSSSGQSMGQGGSRGFNFGSSNSSSSGSNWGANRGRGSNESENHGYNETMEFEIEPGDFARILKTGGKGNGYEVTGVWFQGGRVFKANGKNMMIKSFLQK